MNTYIIDEVIEQLKTMSQYQQAQVLEFVNQLVKNEIKGTPGKGLLSFAGSIHSDDIQLMLEAIEQDCEQVDINW